MGEIIKQADISTELILQVINQALQNHKQNDKSYKAVQDRLTKAQEKNDISKIAECQQQLVEIEQRYSSMENWLANVNQHSLKRKSAIATHLSKGIHSSSQGKNINYLSLTRPKLTEQSYAFVASATIMPPVDCSGDAIINAAMVEIFKLFNHAVTDEITLLDLLIEEHPALLATFSNDPQITAEYVKNLKRCLLANDWSKPTVCGLNKQLLWPVAEQPSLSALSDHYHGLVPLHPSSLTHIVYQKVQQRFSEENKTARKDKSAARPYFSFHGLAVVKLGGNNPQNVSHLTIQQSGYNYLLPSLPPSYKKLNQIVITKKQQSIFDRQLYSRCIEGFKELFAVVQLRDSDKNKAMRDRRKTALDMILNEVLSVAQEIQSANHRSADWSREYDLDISQKCWLNPQRAELAEETEFAKIYEAGDWIEEIKSQFAHWINNKLRKYFPNRKTEIGDAEFNEWYHEIEDAIKASQRKREGIF